SHLRRSADATLAAWTPIRCHREARHRHDQRGPNPLQRTRPCMNRLLDSETLNELLAQREAPCLSLYQPTHRSFPERQQDSIRFRHLVRQLEDSLKQQGWGEQANALLRPFLALIEDTDFWNHNLD